MVFDDGFDPEIMTDEEIEKSLAKKYPPEDFVVGWTWYFPDERAGFCLNVAYKHAISVKDVEDNLYG